MNMKTVMILLRKLVRKSEYSKLIIPKNFQYWPNLFLVKHTCTRAFLTRNKQFEPALKFAKSFRSWVLGVYQKFLSSRVFCDLLNVQVLFCF